ncbi:adenylate/guanylate cyclase domain-containing protein [Psychrobacter urativorans]|uniref:adenylate/guanylate cyclase domain-containing protein n=1 Tax=Psychrobacter urativorans TaxID=45610 RepID=UPI003BB58647
MVVLEPLKPDPSSKSHTVGSFDYPEVLVLLLTVTLIVLHSKFTPESMALFVAVSIPSLMILIYNYRRQTSFWTSNIVVILLSTVIGSMQFCVVLSLSLSLLIGVRILTSEPDSRLRLLIISMVSIWIFYYVSITLNDNKLDCNTGWLPSSVLLASIAVILQQFWHMHHQYLSYNTTAKQATGQAKTMLSIINKLTLFIPLQVWQPIVKENKPVSIDNKRAKLSIMFSDIAGFTELSDSLSADNLAEILNTYMQCMTAIAHKHEAVLDKFIGDGMVCFFGEPSSRGTRQDALDCVAMAIDMRREMRSLRQKWRLMGFEGLYVRIGITTGYCHVGNFGSDNRLSYTVIGREANLAARLEVMAGKGEILISRPTHDYVCHDYECEYVGAFQLKGFNKEIETWQVLDPSANEDQLSKWVDHTLPGFNLHLNFKDMQDEDYQEIRSRLNFALERIERESNAATTEPAEQQVVPDTNK